MPIGIDYKKHPSLDKTERYEKELRNKGEKIVNLETENAMLRLRIAQLMRSQQVTCDGATIARLRYQHQMDSLASKSKQKIQELKQNLVQTKEEMRQFELKASEQLQHVSRVVHQQLHSSRFESSTVSELQETVITLRDQLNDITNKHDKEKKKRRQLHNDLMELRGNIRVHCRLRPLLALDTPNEATPSLNSSTEKSQTVVHYVDDENVCVQTSKHNKAFEFERVYGPKDNQDDVFNQVQPMLTSLLDGYNVCIMAYGQTGSGKTHTMLGSHKNENYNLSHEAQPNEGVIPRAMRELFSLMAEKSEGTYIAEVSVVEIYNNDIRDLLSKDCNLKHDLVTNSDGSLTLPTVTFKRVATVESVMSCVMHGLCTRRESSTLVHEHSSRSHLVVTLRITTKDPAAWNSVSYRHSASDISSGVASQFNSREKSASPTTPSSPLPLCPGIVKTKLQLVDLAGSECVGLSGVKGAAFRETAHINKSLSALADVLGALSEHRSHVPYRNSRLTHFLQDSIGGDAKLLLLLCVSPTRYYVTESLQCLGFGQRARQVQRGPTKRRLPAGIEKMDISSGRCRSKTPPFANR